MSNALAGRKTVVKCCATEAGTYVVVKGIKSASVDINGQQIDVSEFGADWKESLRGLLDAGIELSGNYRSDDTTGQKAIRDAFIEDTDLFLQVLFDGVKGFQMKAQITKFAPDAGVDKEVSLSISGMQTGGVTFLD